MLVKTLFSGGFINMYFKFVTPFGSYFKEKTYIAFPGMFISDLIF